MRRRNVHILAPGVNSTTDLAFSNLASHRLRLSVAALGFKSLSDCHVTVGERVPMKPDILLVGKIGAQQITERLPMWLDTMLQVKGAGGQVILDYTDNHLVHESVMTPFYKEAVLLAHKIVTPSEGMRKFFLGATQSLVTVIPDALEYQPAPPRDTKTKIGVWFGHGSNVAYLIEFFKVNAVAKYFDELIVCTDANTLRSMRAHALSTMLPAIRPVVWSIENQRRALTAADFAFLPVGVNDPKKSGAGGNRLLTALLLGLPVFTQTIQAYIPFQDYYVDLDLEEWPSLVSNLGTLRHMPLLAQQRILGLYNPKNLSREWALGID